MVMCGQHCEYTYDKKTQVYTAYWRGVLGPYDEINSNKIPLSTRIAWQKIVGKGTGSTPVKACQNAAHSVCFQRYGRKCTQLPPTCTVTPYKAPTTTTTKAPTTTDTLSDKRLKVLPDGRICMACEWWDIPCGLDAFLVYGGKYTRCADGTFQGSKKDLPNATSSQINTKSNQQRVDANGNQICDDRPGLEYISCVVSKTFNNFGNFTTDAFRGVNEKSGMIPLVLLGIAGIMLIMAFK